MNEKSILTRDTDGKEFIVIEVGHWSRIRSMDFENQEEYYVKCYGPDKYVGVQGPSFTLKK